MKTGKFLIAAMLLSLTVGCASKKDSSPAASSLLGCGSSYCETVVTPETATGTGTDPVITGYATGSTATLNLSSGALARLFYNSRPTNPTNVRINISLASVSETVIISYIQNGILYEAAFGTQHPDVSYSNAMYNGWVTENGRQVWKGFFQDRYGAIVLIVDNSSNSGDGQVSTLLGGQIWFQNFQQTPIDNPIQGWKKMCWEITLGPYDCRSFLVSSNGIYDKNAKVVMSSASTPSTRGHQKTVSYEQLGTFSAITPAAAGF
ncbi:MAG: hypothetical protein EOP05_05635 [Proteobacteria bacterium]|nr:MAG: hypothetical protein EOP05_05635 [Pseudomonadota bacterium]